jgi:endonuclease/exonuclease/phosphatase family metal-dependent hydrolase
MKIITWNIQVDLRPSSGSWDGRKDIFREAISREKPDIFCLQEVLPHQIGFFAESFKNYQHIGAGRDDGGVKGEQCPIFYDVQTLGLTDHGTFWLSDTPEKPSRGYDMYPRICTWGKFRDNGSGKDFLVFNVHLPLFFNLWGKRKATKALLRKIALFEDLPMILAGDFNSGPGSRVWRMIYDSGFERIPDAGPTCHVGGRPMFTFDAIFPTKEWDIKKYEMLKDNRHSLYPSDHFGVVAALN